MAKRRDRVANESAPTTRGTGAVSEDQKAGDAGRVTIQEHVVAVVIIIDQESDSGDLVLCPLCGAGDISYTTHDSGAVSSPVQVLSYRMGWIERLKSSSRLSKEAVAPSVDNEEETVIAPPQTAHVAYRQDDGEQITFERPGAPRLVRSARSESSTAAAFNNSFFSQQQRQAPCSVHQIEEDASNQLSTACASNILGSGTVGAAAASGPLKQQQLQGLQQQAAVAVAAAAEAAVDLEGLQQRLRTSSSPAAFYSSIKYRPPARHASIDAGYVQHKAMTAVTSLSCYPPSRADSTCRVSETPAAAPESGCPRTLSNLSNISNSSGSNVFTAVPTASNEDIEIGWVWPPCLASDAGPVEFAVNVAPAEWLSGKRSLTRVPCWPVSGLSLHIVHGEQLLQVVDIDICGTTTVKLQLPPTLTSSNELNFIMVMLVDHGKVGPATQLLTMPSSAAAEFCGLFSMLVEHEMLPRSAAHPEFVSLLFGSSGCSSASTLPTVSGMLAHEGDAAGGQPSCAQAGACWDAGTSVAAAAHVLSPRQHQLHKHTVAPATLLQSSGNRTGRHHHHRRRRHSTTLCISGRPLVVQKWSAHTPGAGSMVEAPGTQGAGVQGSVPARRSSRRERRASDSEAFLHAVPDSWTIDEHITADFSSLTGQTFTGPGQSNFDHVVVDHGTALRSSSAAAIVAAAAEIEEATYTNDSSAGRETLADDLESVSTNAAAAANAAQAAGLMFFVDDGEASADGTSVTVPASSPDKAAAAAAIDQLIKPSKIKSDFAPADAATAAIDTQTGSRNSLSLDRCAMHVHNEVDRAQRTRTRLSLDEGIWSLAASRAANRADAIGCGMGGPTTARSSWIAAGLLEGMWSRMGLQYAGSNGTAAATAAVAGEAATENAWGSIDAAAAAAAAARGGSMAPSSAAASATCEEALEVISSGLQAATHSTPATEHGNRNVVSAQGDAAAAAAAAAATAAVAVATPKLECRSAAEANMAAAFTAAWTRHMLELASDLQYLVVCVPWAFAGHFEAWFGRIVSAKGSAEGRDCFLAQHTAEQRSESTWDSAMYMRRLGEVMDTLQMHNMWVTMALLLQHCWQGGLDLYPAGQLFTHLQRQQQQQQWTPFQPLDPDLFSPEYLQQIGRQDIGPASGWIRPVPADPAAADHSATTASLGPATAAAAASSSKRSSLSSAADLSKGLVAERAAAASAANARRRSMEQPLPSSAAAAGAAAASSSNAVAAGSSTSSGTVGSLRQQQRRRRPSSGPGSAPDSNGRPSSHRPPRRSVSWPLGVLYSALSWAQNAQRKHRQRTTWQRGWQLHTLHEESERGSTSSACTSSFDTYRSSTSTTRSSSCAAAPAASRGHGTTAAAAAGRSSRGSVGVAAAAASSMHGTAVVPALQAQPAAADPFVQQQQLQLQQQLARHNAVLALAAAAAGTSAGSETHQTHAAAGGRGAYLPNNGLQVRPASADVAAGSPARLPAWQQHQQQQQDRAGTWSEAQQYSQQQHWQQQRRSEPGCARPDDGWANHQQQQQQQQQASYQRWLAGDIPPAHWHVSHHARCPASYATQSRASYTATRAASYTADHSGPSYTNGGSASPGGPGSSTATASGHVSTALYGGCRSTDAVILTPPVEQQHSSAALQSSLFGPAPLPKAKVQGLQAGLFAQAKLPEQQLQLLEQQQREREQQLAQQQQQQKQKKTESVLESSGINGSEPCDQHLQQQQQQESAQALLVGNNAWVHAPVQAAAVQAAAIQTAAIQAAAALADSAARAADSSSHCMEPIHLQQQQDSLTHMLLPEMSAAASHIHSNACHKQQQGQAPGQMQQQQGCMQRPSCDYAPHTPREKQPHPSYERGMRSSCEQQQQQHCSFNAQGGWSTVKQQQQAMTARPPADFMLQQRNMPACFETGVHARAPVAVAELHKLRPAWTTAAAAAASKGLELPQPNVTSSVLCTDAPDPTESAAHHLSNHADSADQAVQQVQLSEEAVQSVQQQLDSSTTAVQGKYEAQAAAAAAAAEATASVLAAAIRVEQAVSQLLVVLVLLYCLCYLPSLLPGLQPQHIESAMAARPGWFEPVLLVLLAVHMYTGQILVKTQAGINPSQGSTNAGCAANSTDSRSPAEIGTSNSSGPGASDESLTTAAAAAAAALTTLSSEATAAQQQQQQGHCIPPTKKQQRQERQRQRRHLARQQVLLLRCVLSAAAGAAAAGMSCYSLWLFWQSSMLLWGQLQQCGWGSCSSV